jgi:hypothetical protein
MTREQYIQMRANGNFNIIHEYYKEFFDSSKHSPLLSIEQLAQTLPMFGDPNVVFEKCCRHYNEKFSIVDLKDKDGKIIKSL